MNTNIPPELMLAKDRLDQAILICRTPLDNDSVERAMRALVNSNGHIEKALKLLGGTEDAEKLGL